MSEELQREEEIAFRDLWRKEEQWLLENEGKELNFLKYIESRIKADIKSISTENLKRAYMEFYNHAASFENGGIDSGRKKQWTDSHPIIEFRKYRNISEEIASELKARNISEFTLVDVCKDNEGHTSTTTITMTVREIFKY